MSYTFRVIFDGVCGYVPERPFFKATKKPKENQGEENGNKRADGSNLAQAAQAKQAEQAAQAGAGSEETQDRKEPSQDPRAPGGETSGQEGGGQTYPEYEKETEIDSFAVLLPDLRRAGEAMVPAQEQAPSGGQSDEAAELHFPRLRHPHFPLVKFRLADLREGTTRRVDLVCRDIAEQDECGLLFLRREQIRFHLAAQNARKFSFAGTIPDVLADGTPRPVPHPADRDELESLWWLPDLERIVEPGDKETAATVDPRCLPSFLGPLAPGLIARVECRGGRLRTFDFNRSVDGRPLVWRFAAPGDITEEGTWHQAIGNSLALEFFDVRGEVTIEVKRLANEVITRELVLGPAPGASEPVLEVEISNREPDLLFQEEGLTRAVLPDMDFQAFYQDLSRVEDKERIRELPVPHPSRQYFFGIHEKPCAGASMRAWPDTGRDR